MADSENTTVDTSSPGLRTSESVTPIVADGGLVLGPDGLPHTVHYDIVQNSATVPESRDCPNVGSHFRGVPRNIEPGTFAKCPWCGFRTSD